MSAKLYDALIIGGGPAGLSIATALARQVYSALIIDSGVYRNERASHMHLVPGFDHANPYDFRAKVRSDLHNRYPSIEYKKATVKQVRKLDDGTFEAIEDNGAVYRGKKLGLATGVRDILEGEAEGYEECWGRGIFHCLFCHGYEERGQDSVGVIGTGLISNSDIMLHAAPNAARLAKHVNIYTNDNASLLASTKAGLHSSKFAFDDRKITKYRLVDGGPAVEITFADGSTKTEGWLVSHPNVEQRAPFAEQLGLELGPMSSITVQPPFNETAVKGCFAAGDAATPMKNVVQALHMGSFGAAGMTSQLQHELDEKDEL
ncbi:hypothetical protein R3P38DRAFT_2511450 [Favolaschia claudopus]|uniref:FAD/NAD(P)-binding domain-containing protein n=1 Tax=Favolaschia claudopus TaxID=2862362 RepID=A0AAW0CQQ3_9AGAR